MLDINKLRNAYNVIHRMSQNRHPFAEEELSLEVVQSAQVQEALTDAAEVISVYGKCRRARALRLPPKLLRQLKAALLWSRMT